MCTRTDVSDTGRNLSARDTHPTENHILERRGSAKTFTCVRYEGLVKYGQSWDIIYLERWVHYQQQQQNSVDTFVSRHVLIYT